MIPTLVFDIETIPDTDGLKGLLGLPAKTSLMKSNLCHIISRRFSRQAKQAF